MAENEINSLLRAGIEAARAGNKKEARQLLRQVIERDPKNEMAWLWTASVADTIQERGQYLERVLQINPANTRAAQELGKLRIALAQQAQDAEIPAEVPAPATPENREKVTPPAPIVTDAPLSSTPVTRPDFVPVLKERSQRGFFSNPSRIVIGLFVIVLVLGGIAGALALPLINQPQPVPTPTLVAVRPTQSFADAQRTRDVQSLPPPARSTIITSIPSVIAFTIPSWTPIPSLTPLPSQTPTVTPRPLAGLTLLFSGEGRGRAAIGLYTIRADGQNETLLSTGAERAFDGAFSPDGRQIAYITLVDGREQLAVADAGGANPRVLTQFTGKLTRTPAWSPDGTKLALISNQTGNDEVYVVRLDGTPAERLTNAKVNSRDPAWAPDGKSLLFSSDVSGRGSFQIFSLVLATNARLQLTESQNSNFNPSYSPDGSRIVFSSTRDRKSNIYVMSSDGDDERVLTVDDGGSENRDPAWSPDGRWIAFSSTRDTNVYNIFIMALDGTQVQQITSQKNVSVGPRFKPGS